MKYTPPPKFKGQNTDRGFNKVKPLPDKKVKDFNKVNPDTGKPYIRVWIPD